MDTSALLVASLFAGFLPMLLWAYIVWWMDRFEKEPVILLGLAFFWGAAPATLFALISEFVLNIPLGRWLGGQSLPFYFMSTGVIGPVVEEIVKAFGILCLFFLAQSEIDGPLDGVIYAIFVGLGFTAMENMLFFLSSRTILEWIGLVIIRCFLFGLNHAVFAALIGFGFAMAWHTKSALHRAFWSLGGLGMAIGFHTLFNLSLVLTTPFPTFFVGSIFDTSIGISLVLVLFFLGLQHDQQAIRLYLPPYLEAGLIAPEDFTIVQSIRMRLLFEWQALWRRKFNHYRYSSILFSLYAELALKEKQKATKGNSDVLQQKITKICGRISQFQILRNSQNIRLV
jgi:protease PrsW